MYTADIHYPFGFIVIKIALRGLPRNLDV